MRFPFTRRPARCWHGGRATRRGSPSARSASPWPRSSANPSPASWTPASRAPAAVTGGLALLGLFLALDHSARVLQAYPAGRADLLGATLRRAAVSLAPVVIGLTIFFVLSPPRRLPRMRFAASVPRTRDEELSLAYRRLVVFALAGSGLVFGIVRLLRRDRDRRPPLEEALPLERGG